LDSERPGSLPYHGQERFEAGYGTRLARHNDGQLSCRCELGATEDRSGYVFETPGFVSRSEVAGQSDRDGGHVHVDETLRGSIEQRVDHR
jgi:hypothetical protein